MTTVRYGSTVRGPLTFGQPVEIALTAVAVGSKPPAPKPPTPTPVPPKPLPPPPKPPPVILRPAMPFPTDAEQLTFSKDLEAVYRDEMHRPVEETHVDLLGRARWYGDFRTECLSIGAVAASRKILSAIRSIERLPNPHP